MRGGRLRAAVLVLTTAILAATGTALAPGAAAVVDPAPLASWRPDNGHTYAMVRAGDTMVLGGDFSWMRGPDGSVTRRYGLAAVSLTTGELLPWAPAVDGAVWSLELTPDGGSVYVGGSFTAVGGTARGNLARVGLSSGAVASWRADTNGQVRDTALHDGQLYVVGSFSTVGGQSRGRGATLDPGSAAVGAWNPRANSGIRSVAFGPTGATAYLGGTFTTLSGAAREFAGAVDATSGAVTSWVPRSSCNDANNPCYVFDVVVTDDLVHLAVGGPGGRVTTLDRATGFERWWAGGDGDVQVLRLRDGKLYAGGHFDTAFAGSPRAGVVVLDALSGAVLPDVTARVLGWSGVWAMTLDGSRFGIGGHFETVDGVTTRRYAAFSVVPDPADTSPPSVPGSVVAPAALSDEVSLSWNESQDDVAVSHYVVHRDGQPVAEVNRPFFRDRTVLPGTQYRYTVRAVDTSGNAGDASGVVTVTTEAARSLLVGHTTPVRFLSTGNAPSGAWTTTGYDDSGWSVGAGELGYGDGDEDTFISPLGVAHYFRTAFTIPDLSAVSGQRLRLLVDDGAVVYLNGSELVRENMPNGTVSSTTLASSGIGGTGEMDWSTYAVPGGRLVQGANVLAVEVHNASSSSSDVSYAARVEYTPQSAPATPTGLTATATSSSSVDLTWGSAAGATGYDVQRGGTTVATVASPAFTDTGLTESTQYSYRVLARNASGASAPSAAVSVTTSAAPAPPASPAAPVLTAPSSTSVQVGWSAVAGATGYTVRRDGTAVATTSSTSFLDSGLSPQTQYTYSVVASNDAGSSAPGPGASVTTPAAPAAPPPAPTGLASSAVTSTAATLSWQPAAGAESYTVQRDGTAVATVTGTGWEDTGLSADLTYDYRVLASNGNGSSAPSATLTVRTRTLLLSGDTWRMNGTGADLGTAWRAPTYDDSSWQRGPSQWGVGDGDEATVLQWATAPRPVTAYGRTTVDIGPTTADVTALRMRLLVDDGCVVYVNGSEVYRFNLPTGPIDSQTRALRYIAGSEENLWRTVDVPASALVPGRNVVAVEVHQDQPSSSDISLDLELGPVR
ncbi:fibronectin type III domain-containing protein [Phycicoccus flavus]|uniref:fibronectin type III domain-containing protein n=1 Tax=Phycicoccus flavus TaxID=2502783 RepID=UPI000FEBAA4A|nr:fibronectin type III domain-containing protein [Phycicoccus flavus]NHA66598.1 fibronectin type III domain-containing protein [Phycicoccus flavus]